MLLGFEREFYTLYDHLQWAENLLNETISEIIAFWISVKPVCRIRQMNIVSSNTAVLWYFTLGFLQKQGAEACSNVSYIKKQINVFK